MRLNISKIDSKGRVAIPFHIRKNMNIEYGDQLVIEARERGLRAYPIYGDIEIRIRFKDFAGSMKNITRILEKNGINILGSESEITEDGFLWSAILNTSNYNYDKLKKNLLAINTVDDVLVSSR